MSLERAKKYLGEKGFLDRVIEPEASTATVELAAAAVGVEPGRICKSLSFLLEDKPIVILAEGMARVNNKKYKAQFGKKARMIPRESVEAYTGHEAGGVCPFGLDKGVTVYMDESLRKFDRVYPAAGDAHTAVDLTVEELERAARPLGWVDVTKEPAPV